MPAQFEWELAMPVSVLLMYFLWTVWRYFRRIVKRFQLQPGNVVLEHSSSGIWYGGRQIFVRGQAFRVLLVRLTMRRRVTLGPRYGPVQGVARRCRCGARQAQRVGAIRSCALRCASPRAGCAVAPPLWPSRYDWYACVLRVRSRSTRIMSGA